MKRELQPGLSSLRLISALLIVALAIPGASPRALAEPGKEGRRQRIRVNRELLWSMLENLISINENVVAESVLHEHLSRDPLDGRSWIFLAQAQLRLGRPDEASASLAKARRIVGRDEPRMLAYVDAELKQASGRRQEALGQFRALSSQEGVIAEKARRAVDALEAPRARRRPSSLVGVPAFIEPKTVSPRQRIEKVSPSAGSSTATASVPWEGSGNLSFLTGYDGNILQIPDAIAPFASGLGSAYSTVGFQGVLSAEKWGGGVGLSGTAAYTYHTSELAQGLNNLSLGLGAQWGLLPAEDSRWNFTLASSASTTLMQSNSYSFYAWNASLQPTWAYRLTERESFEFFASLGTNQFPGAEVTSPSDNRNGLQTGVGAGLRGGMGAYTYTTGLGYTRQNAQGPNFRTSGISASGSLSRPLAFWQSTLSSTVGFSRVDYPSSSTPRQDKLYSATLGWDVPVGWAGQDLKTTTTAGWSRSESLDPLAAFSKFTINFQVVYGIK